MAEYKTTIVTMFFNLKNLSDASEYTRPTEWYLENSRKTLSLPFPMVIFCDAVTQPALEAIRNEYTALTNAPTQYIIKDITEYDFYTNNYPIITRHRENSRIYTKQNRNTTSYFILTLFKFIGLTIAKHRNDYNTSYYAWLDIGCSHVASTNFEDYAMKIFSNPLPKVRACYIHYRSPKEINDMVHYTSRALCGIAAGLITVQREYVEPLYTAVLSVFYEMLSRSVGHSEETCLVYVYHRFPHFFNIYYGDYYSLLSNYYTVRRDYPAVKRYFIENALNDNRQDLAKDAAQNVLESVDLNLLTLEVNEIEWLRKL
jgi:hypothetical protein